MGFWSRKSSNVQLFDECGDYHFDSDFVAVGNEGNDIEITAQEMGLSGQTFKNMDRNELLSRVRLAAQKRGWNPNLSNAQIAFHPNNKVLIETGEPLEKNSNHLSEKTNGVSSINTHGRHWKNI